MTSYVANPAVAVATAQQVVAYATASAVSNDEVGTMLEKLVAEVEIVLTAMGPATPPSQQAALHSLLESIILTRRSRDAGAAMALLKKVSNARARARGLSVCSTARSRTTIADCDVKFTDCCPNTGCRGLVRRPYDLQWYHRFGSCVAVQRHALAYSEVSSRSARLRYAVD